MTAETGQAPEILFEVIGTTGVLTLNRPAALNALNLDMIRLMTTHLKAAAANPAIGAVIVRAAGERAFCSGGDVKAVALEAMEGTAGSPLAKAFFSEEYALNILIHSFPKPYISLINGIVMGGGKGISAHGSHRVVTENTLFAMPETNIGFFPDVGGGYFLPRCPGQTGLYLALTSKRIKAADTLYIGFATHYVPQAKTAALEDALTAAVWPQDKDAAVKTADDIIGRFAEPAPAASEIAPNRDSIDRCFGHDRMEDILAALQSLPDDHSFKTETLAALNGMSPTSLKVALKQIRAGAAMKFTDVMTMEYRLSQRLVGMHDFYEGIRAALIDKDRQPKWSPATVAAVDDAAITALFAPLPQDLVIG